MKGFSHMTSCLAIKARLKKEGGGMFRKNGDICLPKKLLSWIWLNISLLMGSSELIPSCVLLACAALLYLVTCLFLNP